MTRISLSLLFVICSSVFFLLSSSIIDAQEDRAFIDKQPKIIEPSTMHLQSVLYKQSLIADYPLLYIGSNKDTIALPQEINISNSKYFPLYGARSANTVKCWLEETGIELIVDTSTKIPCVRESWNWSSTGDLPDIVEEEIKGYPVILKNRTNKFISIGYNSTIALKVEAKNIDEEWYEIESYSGGCKSGAREIVIPPNRIAISSCPAFRGKKKVLTRLRLGLSYSNEFFSFIDEKKAI